MAAHEQSVGTTDEWYTPPWVFKALGVEFDTDAASPGKDVVPWIPARNHITSDALLQEWFGKVWLNPPYGPRNGLRRWLDHLCCHGNGIALVPNRTGADWWQDFAEKADALLFVRGKIRFLRPDGSEGASPGYGNVLMAFGEPMAKSLCSSRLDGFRTWKRYEL
jgi:hypothetical protein